MNETHLCPQEAPSLEEHRRENEQVYPNTTTKQHGGSTQPPALPLRDKMGSREQSVQYLTAKVFNNNIFAVTICQRLC